MWWLRISLLLLMSASANAGTDKFKILVNAFANADYMV